MAAEAQAGNNTLRDLRKRLGQHQEIYFWLFILPLECIMSMGLQSHDRPYQIVFAVALVFWTLKMLTTDFTIREIVWMSLISLLLGINFLGNHEKTLILTAMGVFSAKNVSLDKTFKWAFWLKLAATIGTISLAAAGIIDNPPISLPKYGVYVELYGYGYGHPNSTFGNIFFILTLAILAYKDKLRWYIYLIFTMITLAAYQILVCRTGLVVWLFLLIVLLGYKLSQKWKFERIFLSIFCLLPILFAALICIFTVVAIINPASIIWMNSLLTGRVGLIIHGLGDMGNILFGQIPKQLYDNLNFYLLYNYGIIILLFSLFAHTYSIWRCYKLGKDYEVMILGTLAVYGFMESIVMSIAWNLSLLCLSRILFKEQDV